jgi:hypothetical protein
MSDLTHNELIQTSILETIELLYNELDKNELDGLILLYIETHIIEE